MAFTMPRLAEKGDASFWKKVLTRTILIFAIGFFLNWYPFVQWLNNELVPRTWTWIKADGTTGGVRILGVLQRIALCYFFASVIIYYAKQRSAFLIGLLLLLIYWALCVAGNPVDPYSMQGWFGTAIDKAILGAPHLYQGEGIAFDPEGLVSTMPAIVNVIFGYLVGDYLLKRGGEKLSEHPPAIHPLYQTLTVLFIAAVALLFAGYAWSLSFPVNKKIWTSSYVIVTVGLAIVVLATLVYFIELKQARGAWSRFFVVFGKNPLFIYALSGLIPKTLALIRIPNGIDNQGQPKFFTGFYWTYERIWSKVPGPPEIGSFLFALFFVLFLWLVAYWMDKKRIYIKV
jgi:predicted acyltransferase